MDRVDWIHTAQGAQRREWTELIGYRQHRGHRGNNGENAKVKLGIKAQEIKSNSTKLTPTWKTKHRSTGPRELGRERREIE